MPQYAILQSHPPDNCPMTNRAVREFALKNLPELPAKAEKAGVKVLLNIHLDHHGPETSDFIDKDTRCDSQVGH